MPACFQRLTINGKRARCCEVRGTEHDHSDSMHPPKHFEVDRLHDFVVAHGYGVPTWVAYRTAADLMAQGADYAEAAAEVVACGLTREGQS